VLRRGFLDGRAGFRVSALQAYYVYLKFAYLRTQNTERRTENPE